MRPTPRVSVFTPSHHPRYLDECLATLQAQTYPDWEWIVLLNQGARWRPEHPDDRVRVEHADDVSEAAAVAGVGAAKRRACAFTRGEILVELDHDDLLAADCLARVVEAFDADPDAVFVYSDCAQINADGSADASRFDLTQGWVYENVDVDGRTVLGLQTLAPTPHNISYIWYAPNHVRAFRWEAYDKVGGYDSRRDILDDQDLMCRLYQLGSFHHIKRCLYLQRMHPGNTQREPETNARIQAETVALYDRHIEANALAWADRAGLAALDLGAAHSKPPGYLGVDQYPGPDVDIVATLPGRIDLPDSSVGVIRAFDFLEHVPQKVELINEIHRLLAPGGMLISQTPSSDGRGAFQDPTHVAFYNENSFWYYTDESYRRYVPEITARFQASRLVTHCPSPWHEEHRIAYVAANLIAIKEGTPRSGGTLLVEATEATKPAEPAVPPSPAGP